jgi:hypothetical protein
MISAIEELTELLNHVRNRLGKISIDNPEAEPLIWTTKLCVIKASEDLSSARCYLISKETIDDSTPRHQDP